MLKRERPYEVLCNDTSVSFLHILFNICLNTSTVPTIWSKGLINPIPKASTSDPRSPLAYRGITLACCMYKLYSAVLRNRLSSWCENGGKLVKSLFSDVRVEEQVHVKA